MPYQFSTRIGFYILPFAFQEDDGHLSFHGVAYINLAPLLYPGGKIHLIFLTLVGYTVYSWISLSGQVECVSLIR